MLLRIDLRGGVICLYGEAIDLAVLGELSIRRASNVEPDSQGQWRADLSPVAGPVLGPFQMRSQALEAEVRWLEEYLRLLLSPSEPQDGLQTSPMQI